MMSEGTKNIVNAMKARGITKVIGCMSGRKKINLMHLTFVLYFVMVHLCKKSAELCCHVAFFIKYHCPFESFTYCLNHYIIFDFSAT